MSLEMRVDLFLVSKGKKESDCRELPEQRMRWNCLLPKECADSVPCQLWFSLDCVTVYWTLTVTRTVQLHRLFFFKCILCAGHHVNTKIEGTGMHKTVYFPSRSCILGKIDMKLTIRWYRILSAVFMLWTKFCEGMKEELEENHINIRERENYLTF